MGENGISQVLCYDSFTFEQMKELQQMELQHDWEALRNQAAISAMQGMLSNSFDHELMTPDNVAKQSVKYADALILELRKLDT